MAALSSRTLNRLLLAALWATALALALVPPAAPAAQNRPGPAAGPTRIVSLIPAVTEMIFAMGADRRLVGIGDFDRFPPETSRLPRVGGLLDPNTERILSLKPDLVVVYDTQVELKAQLERAGIAMFRYEHRGLADITSTMRSLAARIGETSAGDAAAARIERDLEAVRQRVRGRSRPRTMLVLGREPGAIRRVSVSAGYGFLHDVLELAGGTDVFGDAERQSMDVSIETILARAPEAILELHYGDSLDPARVTRERRVWEALTSLPAVRTGRVHLLVGNEFVVPGPRIVLAAQRFAGVLHP
jgi:iron complex transport system substrate-binding protein